VLSLGPTFLIIRLILGLLIARNLKKRLRNEEIDRETAKKALIKGTGIFCVIGIILSSIGYFGLGTNTALFSMIFGELPIALEGLLLLSFTVVGMCFLGAGIGLVPSLIRKPQ
jgi:hypothetical protein